MKTKTQKSKKKEQEFKPMVGIYYCQGCGQSRFCIVETDKTYCDDCSRSECPKSGHDFERYVIGKYSCCMDREAYSQYYAAM